MYNSMNWKIMYVYIDDRKEMGIDGINRIYTNNLVI